MSRHHVYKSLSADEFMEHFAFALSHSGYYALPAEQQINWMRKAKSLTNDQAKEEFVKLIRIDLDFAQKEKKLTSEVSIVSYDRYYEVMLVDRK